MGEISSVFGPLKGSCKAEGEEKITGADIICFCHVDLTSGLTHCGPVLYPCQADVPAHMLRHDVRTSPTHTDTHVQRRGDKMRACRARGAQVTHLCSLVPRQMHAGHSCFSSFSHHSQGAIAGIYAAWSHSLHKAPLTIYTTQHKEPHVCTCRNNY